MTELETKYLDKDYLEKRLQSFDEIKSGKVGVEIRNSKYCKSQSVYVDFLVGGNKRQTLRISDHFQECPHTQFTVTNRPLTVKKKKQFSARVKKCIKLAILHNFHDTLYNKGE